MWLLGPHRTQSQSSLQSISGCVGMNTASRNSEMYVSPSEYTVPGTCPRGSNAGEDNTCRSFCRGLGPIKLASFATVEYFKMIAV